MGHNLIRREQLGVPQGSRDVFALLGQAGWIDAQLVKTLQNMVGLRNIALHDYQASQLPVVVPVITRYLSEFTEYSEQVLLKDAKGGQ